MAPSLTPDEEINDRMAPLKRKKFYIYVCILSIYYLFGILMYTFGVEEWSFTGYIELLYIVQKTHL